jgi:hypothetical protein
MSNPRYPDEFKIEAVKQVTGRGLPVADVVARAFDSISGEVVSTTAFVIENAAYPNYAGAYIRLVDGKSEAEKRAMLLGAIK